MCSTAAAVRSTAAAVYSTAAAVCSTAAAGVHRPQVHVLVTLLSVAVGVAIDGVLITLFSVAIGVAVDGVCVGCDVAVTVVVIMDVVMCRNTADALLQCVRGLQGAACVQVWGCMRVCVGVYAWK